MIKLPPSTNDTGTIAKMVQTRMNATTVTSPFLAHLGETDKTLIILRFIAENEEIFIRLHVLIDEQCLISSRHGIFF